VLALPPEIEKQLHKDIKILIIDGSKENNANLSKIWELRSNPYLADLIRIELPLSALESEQVKILRNWVALGHGLDLIDGRPYSIRNSVGEAFGMSSGFAHESEKDKVAFAVGEHPLLTGVKRVDFSVDYTSNVDYFFPSFSTSKTNHALFSFKGKYIAVLAKVGNGFIVCRPHIYGNTYDGERFFINLREAAAGYPVPGIETRIISKERPTQSSTPRKVSSEVKLASISQEQVTTLADEVTKKLCAAFPQKRASVVYVKGMDVYINLGIADLIREGLIFEIIREGQEIRDPTTGKVLGHEEEEIAEVKIERIRDKVSIAKLTDDQLIGKVKIGDVAIAKALQRRTGLCPFGGPAGRVSDLGLILSGMVATRLAETGRFLLVDRERVEAAIREVKIAPTGLITTNAAKEIAEKLGIDLLISGKVLDLGQVLEVDYEIIDSSGRIVVAGHVTVKKKLPDIES
jgi:hypothetical protein